MRQRLLQWSMAPALLMASCIGSPDSMNSFVEVPADASCKALASALHESGWGRPQYLTVEETWLVHRYTQKGIPARARYKSHKRPAAWAVRISCGDDDGSHQLPVRTCMSRGRLFGVIDPQALRAHYPDLALGTSCWLRISWKRAGGRWWNEYSTTTIQPSARPLLFSDSDEVGRK